MSTIIALKGRASSGKTTTIGMVYELVKARSNVRDLKFEKVTNRDFIAILQIGRRRIGFSSQGDSESQVRKHLTALVDGDCKLILCAARSYGGTHDAINRFNPPYEIEFIQQTYCLAAHAIRIAQCNADNPAN